MDEPFEVRSYCKICHTNCGVLIKRDAQERVLGIRGDPENPRSKGYLCPKGIQTVWAHNRPDRLNYPFLNGRRADWDTTLDDLARKIETAVAKNGPDAFGIYAATGCDDLGYGALRSLTDALGSKQRYTAATVDVAPDWKAAELVTGSFSLAPRWDPADEDVKLLVFFGSNPLVSHGSGITDGARNLRKFRAQGGKVWVFDPVRTRTASAADEHVAPVPGSDPLILAWLVRQVLESLPADSPARQTTKAEDRDRLHTALAPFDLHKVARLAGVDPSSLEGLWADIRAAGRLTLHSGTGTRFGRDGLVTEWLRWALLILTDSLEQPGGMWFSPGWQFPVEKRSWTPAPEGGFADPAPVSRPDLPRNFGETPCAALADEIEHGPLRTFIVIGGNPLTAFPDPRRMERALKSLDALAVLDVLPTSLTEISTHVLTCTGRLERKEYNPIQSDRPQYTEAIVGPAFERRHSFHIVGQLAKRLGLGDKVFGGLDPDEVTEDVLYARNLANARHTFEELRAAGSLGLEYKKRGLRWAIERAIPEGRWRLAPNVLVERLPSLLTTEAEGDLPLRLASGRQERRMNSHQNVERAHKADKPAIHVSPDDAERYGVIDGAFATLRNANGEVTAEVVVDPRMRKGALTLGHGWSEANVCHLTTSRVVDPLTGQPQMTAIPVTLEPALAPTPTSRTDTAALS